MTRILRPGPEAIAEAAALLQAGRLVAFPTETVYGLGADAGNDQAVAAIYEAKGRPSHNPLIVHVPSVAEAGGLALINDRALALARRFWPGPLTLVLERRPGSGLSRRATAGLATVALRVPAHPVAQQVLAAVGRPIAAPSANPSGRVSPTEAAHVAEDLADKVDLVLDAGPCSVGVESTVVDLSDEHRPLLLRPGGLTELQLREVLGEIGPAPADPARPSAPGQLAGHYAPRLPLRLDALAVAADEALLAFGADAPKGAMRMLNLSPSGDLREAAHNLFAMLRRLDRSGARAIAVVPIPATGLGLTIRDRLRRATAAGTTRPTGAPPEAAEAITPSASAP